MMIIINYTVSEQNLRLARNKENSVVIQINIYITENWVAYSTDSYDTVRSTTQRKNIFESLIIDVLVVSSIPSRSIWVFLKKYYFFSMITQSAAFDSHFFNHTHTHSIVGSANLGIRLPLSAA